jgi:SAM-dependent methyltransferase
MKEKPSGESWFEVWFDSPYYHILYSHRDDEEAVFFLNNLLQFLNPEKASKMLDLACGRGRHALFLHAQGYSVTGVDLSPSNIQFAQALAEDGLEFMVHDMRNLLISNYFDYVFNLFTSFGYFDHPHEHSKTVVNMATSLKKGGKVVLDFLNIHAIGLTNEVQKKSYEGYTFHITKHIEGNTIVKTIVVEREGDSHTYQERVALLGKADFEILFEQAGLHIEQFFGNYALEPFDESTSDRLILVGCKR